MKNAMVEVRFDGKVILSVPVWLLATQHFLTRGYGLRAPFQVLVDGVEQVLPEDDE